MAFAVPADAAQVCNQVGGTNQLPAGSTACLTVDTAPGRPDKVTRMHVNLRVPGYWQYQIRGKDPRYGYTYGLSSFYQGGATTDWTTINRDICNGNSEQIAFDFANLEGCGTYPANSKVWVDIYRDSPVVYAGRTELTINPATVPCTPTPCGTC